MVYDNAAELWMNLWDKLERVNFTEKAISIIITLLAFFIIIKVCMFFLNKLFDENRKEKTLPEQKRIVTLRKASKNFIRATLVIVEVLVLLSFFVDVGSLLAVAGVGTIAIGLGAKGFVEDIVSSFVIIYENQFAVGDYVTIDNHYGVVENIGVRTSQIRELDGSLFIIHNGQIDRLTNYSKGLIKGVVDVGVAYEENIDKVITVIKEVANEVYNANKELFAGEPEVLGVTRLDPSAMNIRILFDEDAARKVRAESALRKRIKEVFDERGIEIPYEKRIVYSDQHLKHEAKLIGKE